MGDRFADEPGQDEATKKIGHIMRTQAAPGTATNQQLQAVADGVKEALKDVYDQDMKQKFAAAATAAAEAAAAAAQELAAQQDAKIQELADQLQKNTQGHMQMQEGIQRMEAGMGAAV